jgi:hypothetical protein
LKSETSFLTTFLPESQHKRQKSITVAELNKATIVLEVSSAEYYKKKECGMKELRTKLEISEGNQSTMNLLHQRRQRNNTL